MVVLKFGEPAEVREREIRLGEGTRKEQKVQSHVYEKEHGIFRKLSV